MRTPVQPATVALRKCAELGLPDKERCALEVQYASNMRRQVERDRHALQARSAPETVRPSTGEANGTQSADGLSISVRAVLLEHMPEDSHSAEDVVARVRGG
eukprot:CAMPEP_0119339684 /NCGR_PEP_ID=MMETSP1333-20130426/98798_1 /TAXON_ID=418940 /ORGANISM="Scyphosphaera apsteinii, Strain RCC1455" /LENGTH=101 /DNA_ID=CAMNT_0007351263 /DNA_START=395 /DNA_END=700 /DNA_ORIENTATION=+